MVLLYVPPVQNLLRREVTAYASKATGMQIQVERIDLRFPLNLLVRGVEVIQQPDTLLSLESLNVRVQAWNQQEVACRTIHFSISTDEELLSS